MELLRRGHAFQPPLSSYGEFKPKEKHLPRAPLQPDSTVEHRIIFRFPDFPHSSSLKQEDW
jgi:hypothetical protein